MPIYAIYSLRYLKYKCLKNYTLILKKLPHDHFYSSTYNFRFCTKDCDYNSKDHLENLSNFLKANIKIVKFNSSSIDEKFNLEAKRLLPDKNYVGFSVTQGNVYREKSWHIDNFITLGSKIEEKNKIPVFFIEKKNIDLKEKISNLVPKAQFPEHESNLSSPALVSCLGKRLDFVITIDNGVMHMLALSKVPMISLFGPTNSKKFAPNYKNSIVLDSKKIYNTKSIEAISVEDVLHAAKLHLNF